ncbi:hypothetical protein [Anatilimnocola floriformis]|uniref:hypothetical protein n=1 Tax=Anatilimnocola floriformis TaxID=2948575 RepID=UPI0020C4D833|nr:hypothetical protein [Anatilimnocola floriformis]
MTRESRTPLIVAIVLLLLPVLNVGSYFALVVPQGFVRPYPAGKIGQQFSEQYRYGDMLSERFFWPLESIDRKLRPGAWKDSGSFRELRASYRQSRTASP